MFNHTHSQKKSLARWNIFAATIALSLPLIACGSPQSEETFVIGVVNYVPVLSPALDGFKVEMSELGYVEGENLVYIYNGIVGSDPDAVENEVENLLAQDVDLLFTIGNLPALAAKQAVEGTDISVVFTPIMYPVEEGVVDSVLHPGGNVTGVSNGRGTTKALEWLVTLTPDAKKVYLPYNPNDTVSVTVLGTLENTPSELGIELVLDEVYSVEEAVTAIENLPEDIDAIFRVPSPTLDPRNNELSQAAIARGIPMGSNLLLNESVLVTYAADIFELGRQAARQADQIHRGMKPADLPVESAEFFLTINLKTAEMIDLNVSDDILEQADIIIR